MTDQPNLFAQRDRDSSVLLEPLVYQLLADGQWHTARSFQDVGNVTIKITGIDRMVWLVAERSAGKIISGQKGYKLTKFATTEEIDHAERWLLSQASKMKARALEIRRSRNQGGRAA